MKFDTAWGGPASIIFDTLQSWTTRSEDGIKYYSGMALYIKEFDAPGLNTARRVFIDIGTVVDVGIAKVRLNGNEIGTVWAPPFRLEITKHILHHKNKLEIEVINSWRNRLVGDRGKPQSERFTKTNVKIWENWNLIPSGLLGPVQIFTHPGYDN